MANKAKSEAHAWDHRLVQMSIISIMLFALLALQVKDTGFVTQKQSCFDSDNGKNYAASGYVDYKGYRYIDYCYKTTGLMERYCIGGQLATASYECSKACFDGACV